MKHSRFRFFAFTLSLAFIFTQCINGEYDEPPLGGADPDFITADNTVNVSEVLAMWSPGQATQLSMDMYMEAIIIGDDQSGNIYKTLFVADDNAGMSIIVDEVEMYNNFFEGRKIFINLSNLWIGDFNGNPQLGMAPDTEGDLSRIPAALVEETLFTGTFPETLPVAESRIFQLSTSALNTLVTLNDVQFIDSDTGESYADAVNQQAINRTVEDCDGNLLTIRTSGFASFAGDAIPEGNGSITGIYTIFGSTKQLVIRDLSDVVLEGNRCDGSGGGGGGGGGNTSDECGVMDSCDDVAEITESFEGYEDFDDVSIGCWNNIGVVSCNLWYTRSFDDDGFAETEAYQIEDASMENWLITPPFDLEVVSTLSFTSAVAFHNHDGLSVWISTDFDGVVADATWTELDATLAGSSQANYDWVESGEIDLSSFTGSGRIGFKYVGNPDSQTTKVRINDVQVK